MKIFSIWKGIVSKKSLQELAKYIDESGEYTYKEDENSFEVYSDIHTKYSKDMYEKIISKYNLGCYMICYGVENAGNS